MVYAVCLFFYDAFQAGHSGQSLVNTCVHTVDFSFHGLRHGGGFRYYAVIRLCESMSRAAKFMGLSRHYRKLPKCIKE